ncbi:MAG: hypothetical protein ABJ081_01370 [Hyphomicrobiales bacterium]
MTGLIIHAPTEGALKRARSNYRNYRKLNPDGEIVIVANGPAARTVVDVPDQETDGALLLCENSLIAQNLKAPPYIKTIPAAIVALDEMQIAGWRYVRA